MERFRGHDWLKKFRGAVPRTWVLVRVDAGGGEYFEDGVVGAAAGGGIETSPCAGCGKGAGPGSLPAEIEKMLVGEAG